MKKTVRWKRASSKTYATREEAVAGALKQINRKRIATLTYEVPAKAKKRKGGAK